MHNSSALSPLSLSLSLSLLPLSYLFLSLYLLLHLSITASTLPAYHKSYPFSYISHAQTECIPKYIKWGYYVLRVENGKLKRSTVLRYRLQTLMDMNITVMSGSGLYAGGVYFSF